MQLSNDAPAVAGRGIATADLRRRLHLHREALLGLIEGADGAVLDWSPEDGILSISAHLGVLARREEDMVSRHLRAAWTGPDAEPAGMPLPPVRRDSPCGLHVQELRRIRAATDRWISAASDVDLDRPLPGPPMTGLPTPRDLLESLVAHDVHHRAQIGLLIQLMDPLRIVPPVP